MGRGQIRKVLRRGMPWWAKMSAKVALARLPVGDCVRRSINFGGFGGMGDPAWAYETFTRHLRAAGLDRAEGGFAVLELGPGDSLFTALIARSFGASGCVLVDVEDFAGRDLESYRAIGRFLAARGHAVEGLDEVGSVEAVLGACSARYLTGGLDSLRSLPDASVDFLFSNAVLQAVRRDELFDTLKETRRVLRPDGVASHSVGIWDMMADALNHLRFPARVWESDWLYRSGCYTNRYRFSELLDLFRRAGFEVDVTEVNRWDRLPTPRGRMDPAFRESTDEELRVYSFNVTLRPAQPGSV